MDQEQVKQLDEMLSSIRNILKMDGELMKLHEMRISLLESKVEQLELNNAKLQQQIALLDHPHPAQAVTVSLV